MEKIEFKYLKNGAVPISQAGATRAGRDTMLWAIANRPNEPIVQDFIEYFNNFGMDQEEKEYLDKMKKAANEKRMIQQPEDEIDIIVAAIAKYNGTTTEDITRQLLIKALKTLNHDQINVAVQLYKGESKINIFEPTEEKPKRKPKKQRAVYCEETEHSYRSANLLAKEIGSNSSAIINACKSKKALITGTGKVFHINFI